MPASRKKKTRYRLEQTPFSIVAFLNFLKQTLPFLVSQGLNVPKMVPEGNFDLSVLGSDEGQTIQKGRRKSMAMELPPDWASKPLREIMLDCWHSDPGMRPDFKEIEAKLAVLTKQMGTLADSMMTKRKKEKRLLDSMLPPKVRPLLI